MIFLLYKLIKIFTITIYFDIIIYSIVGDNLNNEKGQALVEFIILLPLIIFMLLAFIDFGNIMIKKGSLQNDLNTVVYMYQNEPEQLEDYVDSIDAVMSVNIEGDMTTIQLTKKINIITPGLNLIYGEKYQLEQERTIYSEQVYE